MEDCPRPGDRAGAGVCQRGDVGGLHPDRLAAGESVSSMTLWHTKCGKQAFIYNGDLTLGALALASSAQHLDGRPMSPGEVGTCDSCGRDVSFHSSCLSVEEPGSPRDERNR